MKDKVVAVVMGGPSSEREVSLRTGKAIADALLDKGYKVVEIDLIPERFAEQLGAIGAQVVFNAIHGLYGEDGKMQGFLDMLGIPYTGSGLQACALSINKIISKQMFLFAGIPTARSLFLRKGNEPDYYKRVITEFGLPVVIKPATQGSTIGISTITEVDQIDEAIASAFGFDKEVLVEEFIAGREFTSTVLRFDNETVVLPEIEIVPHSGVYDYHSKYTVGATTYIVPAKIDEKVSFAIADCSRNVFDLFDCQGVARVDYMMNEQGQLFVLEINTVPGMTQTSLVPKAAAAKGIGFADLCEKILLSVSI